MREDFPVLRPRWDGRWELVQDWGHIPAGFVTDGGSIPRWLWRICGHPLEAPTVVAYIEHDYEYQERTACRRIVDRRFRGRLKTLGVGWLRRWLFWIFVRLFGGRHWTKIKKG